MAQKSLRKTLLSLSIAAVIGVSGSGNAFADGDSVEALEARIAELEALVHQLLQKEPDCCKEKTVDTAAIETKAAEAAEARVTAMLGEHTTGVAETVHKHSYKFGGYIKLDSMFSDFSSGSVAGNSGGREFYIPATIPVGSENASGESYLDFQAKESRINFSSNHILDNGAKLGTFFELDFMLSGQGDERISSSYAPRVRHAFVTYNKWLFGQTWMTFFNVNALPENLDFVGPAESTIFGRQAMIRYTSGNWQLAFENPETTVTPYGGGARIVTDDNKVPDTVLRYNLTGDWGSFAAAGMVRQLRYEGPSGGLQIDDSTTSFSLSLSGKFDFANKDDFRWMATWGDGIGRYIGLNTSNGAVIDENGNLESIEQIGVFGSYRHLWNDQWRSNFTVGYLGIDNDTSLTGMGATSNVTSYHVNVIYSPQPKLDFGLEFLYAEREIESGQDGDLTRFIFSAKYAF
jgi:hypothetical protein